MNNIFDIREYRRYVPILVICEHCEKVYKMQMTESRANYYKATDDKCICKYCGGAADVYV